MYFGPFFKSHLQLDPFSKVIFVYPFSKGIFWDTFSKVIFWTLFQRSFVGPFFKGHLFGPFFKGLSMGAFTVLPPGTGGIHPQLPQKTGRPSHFPQPPVMLVASGGGYGEDFNPLFKGCLEDVLTVIHQGLAPSFFAEAILAIGACPGF